MLGRPSRSTYSTTEALSTALGPSTQSSNTAPEPARMLLRLFGAVLPSLSTFPGRLRQSLYALDGAQQSRGFPNNEGETACNKVSLPVQLAEMKMNQRTLAGWLKHQDSLTEIHN